MVGDALYKTSTQVGREQSDMRDGEQWGGGFRVCSPNRDVG